jgi:hypothetical protein
VQLLELATAEAASVYGLAAKYALQVYLFENTDADTEAVTVPFAAGVTAVGVLGAVPLKQAVETSLPLPS